MCTVQLGAFISEMIRTSLKRLESFCITLHVKMRRRFVTNLYETRESQYTSQIAMLFTLQRLVEIRISVPLNLTTVLTLPFTMEPLTQVEQIIGERLPNGLEKIIEHAGYDTKSSLELLDEDKIKEIENHVNEYKFLLTGTVYENTLQQNINFKFKPGHKTLLLALSKKLNKKTISSQAKKLKLVSDLENSDPKIIRKDINTNELIESLIQKVIKFAEKKKFEIIFVPSNIELSIEKEKIKCSVQCPICNKKIQVQYTTYWLLSNFERHLKSDLNQAQIEEVLIETVPLSYGNLDNANEIEKILSDGV